MKYLLNVIIIYQLYVLQLTHVDGARILGVFPLPARSHFKLDNRLMRELAARGHEVTVISPYQQKPPVKNYRDVHLTEADEIKNNSTTFNVDLLHSNSVYQFQILCNIGQKWTDFCFKHPNVQKLLKSDEKFDLVVYQSSLTEAIAGFAHHYKIPAVLLFPMGYSIWVNEYVKNPILPSYIPLPLLSYTENMSFVQRLKNSILTVLVGLVQHFSHLPAQNEILHKYFPDAPHVSEVMKNTTAIMLLNSHTSTSFAKPVVPNMIEIGGFHIEKPKELPNDLKEYLDSAKNGFILFSLGSNLKSTELPESTRNIFLKVFANLPYKVLWKFEDESLPNKPGNVKIHKWLPQNDVLAHPNLKLFITHGGLLSITETVYHGVPILGIPFVVDQKMNMALAERLGIGKMISFFDLNYGDLSFAIKEVINNTRYLEAVTERSKIMKDQPVSPLDNAIFWVEYTLRHKYSTHFRTGAVNLQWHQILLLDVLGALFASFLLTATIIWLTCKKIFAKGREQFKCIQEKKKQ